MIEMLKEELQIIWEQIKKYAKEPKYWKLAIALCFLFFYLAGLLAQFLNNRYNWTPGKELLLPSINPLRGLAMLTTPFGAQAIMALLLFTIMGVLLAFMFKEDRAGMKYDKKRNFWYSAKGVYGTAGWMDDADIQKCFDLTPEAEAGNVKEVIYGVKDGMVISRKANSMLSEHTAILGSSGSMKSRAFARGKIISCALKGESICCTDPKGELVSDTKVYLEEKGYTVKILNLVDPKNSDRFDGLEGAREEPICVSNIVEAAIANTGGAKGDHFFDAAEGNLLSALIFLQMEHDNGEFPTIKGAYRTLLDARSVEELNDIFDELPPGSRGLRSYNLFRMASQNVQGNVIIGLGARLAVLQNDEIAELMSYPDMDMLSLGKEKTAYFLVLSDQDSTMRFVSAMFFSLLFLRLVQYADSLPERRLPVPVNLILDELCSVVGAINGFHIKMSNVRSRAIHVSFFFQALGQLQNRYPDNMWSEVLSAADTTLIMGCNDPVSAEYVSARSGEVTIYADTVMKQRNIFLPAMLQPNFRHSEGTGRRKLLTLDEVLRMDTKNMLLMLRGQQVLEIEKFDYTRNPESGKFKPVPVKGLKEVPQYQEEDESSDYQPCRRPEGGTRGELVPAREAHRERSE
jgi:type IV secretion system protein VirD4